MPSSFFCCCVSFVESLCLIDTLNWYSCITSNLVRYKMTASPKGSPFMWFPTFQILCCKSRWSNFLSFHRKYYVFTFDISFASQCFNFTYFILAFLSTFYCLSPDLQLYTMFNYTHFIVSFPTTLKTDKSNVCFMFAAALVDSRK